MFIKKLKKGDVLKMEKTILECISNIKWSDLKEYKNLAVIPLFTETAQKNPDYIIMEDAIKANLLIIKEISTGGAVPELLAENSSEKPVLLLDGEEVIGAKQNRILNATILLAANSKTTIPVSCVEAHRWSYNSEKFSHSDSYLNYDIRREKHMDVQASLNLRNEYRADQGKVWERIDQMHMDLKVKSSTGAMHDAYVSVSGNLDEYCKNFKAPEGAIGLFVFIGGKVAGFDLISRSEAFMKVFPKLIKSYAMDAIRVDIKEENMDFKKQAKSKTEQSKPVISIEQAKYFMDEIKSCNENKFKSAGLGYDFRYEGQYSVGSALLYDGTVIHSAFFRVDREDSREDKTGNMSSYRNRIRNRTYHQQ